MWRLDSVRRTRALRTPARWSCPMHQMGWNTGVAALLIAVPAAAPATETGAVAAGRAIAHDVYKGNCLGCHQIPGDPSAVSLANIGPPIADMRSRFPERAALRQQLWDSTVRNPYSVMPPFGRHRILTEEEIDLVLDYVYRY